MREKSLEIGSSILFKSPVTSIEYHAVIEKIIENNLVYVVDQNGQGHFVPTSWIIEKN